MDITVAAVADSGQHDRRESAPQCCCANLRFCALPTDTFMDDFVEVLETDPARLNELVATPGKRGVVRATAPEPLASVPLFARKFNRLGLTAATTRTDLRCDYRRQGVSSLIARARQPGTKEAEALPAGASTLITWLPLHSCAGALVCRITRSTSGRQESVTFVLRRMFPPGPLEYQSRLAAIQCEYLGRTRVRLTPSGTLWKRIPKPDPVVAAPDRRRRAIAAVPYELREG